MLTFTYYAFDWAALKEVTHIMLNVIPMTIAIMP